MERIPPEIIQAIIEGTDIVEIISTYVPLRRSGANYMACCPFHSEKTPSFSVSPTKRIFKCFGCGEGGSVIQFLMKYQNRSFVDVMKELGGRLGISVVDEGNTGLAFQYKLLDFAAGFYASRLQDCKEANDYVASRGMDKEIIREFVIGYAPDNWDELFRACRQQFGFLEDEILEKSGLFSKSSRGSWIDRFRDRIMFPIMNSRGKIVAFGGRVFRSAAQMAKYLNSPDTPLFDKGRLLFNHHRALLHGGDDVIVVEGYMDVISLFQAGFFNVLAPLGTGFTPDQVRLLEKNFRRIYLVFDGDSAGSQATFRAIERFIDSGLIVRSVCLPDKLDPQEFIEKKGRDAFLVELENAKDALRFYCEQIFLKHPLDEIRSKRQAYAALLSFFRKMNPLFLQGDERINQSELIEFLENSFQVNEKIIREQFFAGLIIREMEHVETGSMGSDSSNSCSPKIELGLRLMLRISTNNEFREFFLTEIEKDFLEEGLLEEVYGFLESGQTLLPIELLLPHASMELSRYLSDLNWGEDIISPLQEKAEFLHFLRDLGIQLFQEKIDKLSRTLYAENYTNEDEKKSIFQTREQFRAKKTEWMKKFSDSGLEILKL